MNVMGLKMKEKTSPEIEIFLLLRFDGVEEEGKEISSSL